MQELTFDEIELVDGGIAPLLVLAIGVGLFVVATAVF